MKRSVLFLALSFLLTTAFSQQKSLFLQSSANGRFIQWSDGKPFFINACTALTLTSAYADKEVLEYLDDRLAAKFNAIQISAVFAERIPSMADSAFTENDLLKPVPKYWERIDWVVKQAIDRKLVVLINPIWKQSLEDFIKANGAEKCREFGKWFANRYKGNPYLIYYIGGGGTPEPIRSELEEMGKGIQEVYGGKALIAYQGESGQSSIEAFPNASWLTMNWITAYLPDSGQYPYSENYDSWKLFPKIPIHFCKGFYDGGGVQDESSGHVADRYVLRRQAWWNLLSGGAGNAWGAEGICCKEFGDLTWSAGLLYGSNKDMGFMKLFVDKVKWWKLQPDVDHRLLTGGFGTIQTSDFAVCSVSDNGMQAVIYTPVKQSLEIYLPEYGQNCRLRWFDPSDGKYSKIDMRFPKKKKKSVIISTPGLNHRGRKNWVLIIERKLVKKFKSFFLQLIKR